jgi:hypothetical protein
MFRLYAVIAITASAFEMGGDVSTTTTAEPTEENEFLEAYRVLTGNVSNASVEPTAQPTAVPTVGPTLAPTAVPTVGPTAMPTPVPTIAPTPVPSMDTVCDNWKDANVYPAMVLPTAWGSELPLQCLADWKAANPERDTAFGPFSRLLAEADIELVTEVPTEIKDEPDVVTTTTAEPTEDAWSTEDRAKAEFLASYGVRVLSGNDTNVSTPAGTPTAMPTPLPTNAPTPAPTPAPTACPVETMTTYNVHVRMGVSTTTSMSAACMLLAVEGVADYLNYPYAKAKAVDSSEIGAASQFFSLDPEYSTPAAASGGFIILTGKMKVNAAHAATLTSALGNTESDTGCAYQLGDKIKTKLATGTDCPTVTTAKLLQQDGPATSGPTPAPTPPPTTLAPTAIPTVAPTPAPTPEPSMPAAEIIEYTAEEAEAALEESAQALFDSGNLVIQAEVGFPMSPEAFDELTKKPQESAISFRNGYAATIGKLPEQFSEVVIPQTLADGTPGINPSIGTFTLVYDFGDRRLSVAGRRLFDGSLSVTFDVAVSPAEATAMKTTMSSVDPVALQANTKEALVANGMDAVANDIEVPMPGEVSDPVAPPEPPAATPPPTAAAATPKPTAADDDEEEEPAPEPAGTNPAIFVVGAIVIFAILGGIGYVAMQQQGAAGDAPKAAEEAPAAAPAATEAAPAPEAAASPAAAPESPAKDPSTIDTAVEPTLEVSGDFQADTANHDVMSAAVQIDESTRATSCCVVCG